MRSNGQTCLRQKPEIEILYFRKKDLLIFNLYNCKNNFFSDKEAEEFYKDLNIYLTLI